MLCVAVFCVIFLLAVAVPLLTHLLFLYSLLYIVCLSLRFLRPIIKVVLCVCLVHMSFIAVMLVCHRAMRMGSVIFYVLSDLQACQM